MKKPKKQSAADDPRKVFDHACRFLTAEKYLSELNGTQAWRFTVALPTLVLSAFAAELFLKCLVILTTGKTPTSTHQLHVLYRQIGHKEKRRIEQVWDVDGVPQISDLSARLKLPTDLPNALYRCSKGFENIRYGYESDWDGVVYYISGLPRVLIKVILELKPEWNGPIQHEPFRTAPHTIDEMRRG